MSDTSGEPRDPGGDERLQWQQPLLHGWWGGGGRKESRFHQSAGTEGGVAGEEGKQQIRWESAATQRRRLRGDRYESKLSLSHCHWVRHGPPWRRRGAVRQSLRENRRVIQHTGVMGKCCVVGVLAGLRGVTRCCDPRKKPLPAADIIMRIGV